MRQHQGGGALFSAALAVLTIAGSARGEEVRSVPPLGRDVLMSRFWSTPLRCAQAVHRTGGEQWTNSYFLRSPMRV